MYILILAAAVLCGQQPARVPTLERLKPEYLQRAHDDVAALTAARKPVATKSGRLDLRCILHAHSYLSHDSRGTIAEIAAAAKAVGVDAVLLSNHPQKMLDVVAAGQISDVDGVLFFSGAETNGFLAYPGDGKLPSLDVAEQPFVEAINASHGMVFVAHPEEHTDWALKGLTGMEIYNTHADLKDETEMLKALQPKDAAGYGRVLSMLSVFQKYPREAFAALFDPPVENLKHYDAICAGALTPNPSPKNGRGEASTRHVAAIAGNDSHQNTGFVLKGEEGGKILVESPIGEKLGEIDTNKTPLAKVLLGEPKSGQEMMRRILDPYSVSFHYVSTHVLATARTKAAIQQALEEGRTYVAFDWMADPTGSVFGIRGAFQWGTIGDSVRVIETPVRIHVELPIHADIRTIRDGKEISRMQGQNMELTVDKPGVYRVEAWLTIAGEPRPWIYTSAMYVRP